VKLEPMLHPAIRLDWVGRDSNALNMLMLEKPRQRASELDFFALHGTAGRHGVHAVVGQSRGMLTVPRESVDSRFDQRVLQVDLVQQSEAAHLSLKKDARRCRTTPEGQGSPCQCWADYITAMSEFEFPTNTRG
jgi:hypothetical protein